MLGTGVLTAGPGFGGLDTYNIGAAKKSTNEEWCPLSLGRKAKGGRNSNLRIMHIQETGTGSRTLDMSWPKT